MSSNDSYYEYYDLFYRDKDYAGECDFIEDIFQKHAARPVKDILDLGCGTGGHALLLAELGYHVTGIDASEKMLERAGQRTAAARASLELQQGDIRSFQLGRRFDAAICMFAVMDYLTETSDVLQTLRNIRQHLREDGLFVFDFWNGLAELRLLPEVRSATFEDRGLTVVRNVRPELDAMNHLCRVNYHLVVSDGGRAVEEIRETHVIRFFFPREMAHYLEECGFELLEICPFPNLSGQADENTWNIAAIARAVSGGTS